MSIKHITNRVIEIVKYPLYLLWIFFSKKELTVSKEICIDVVIPIIEKDLEILPLCIEGIKHNVDHTIKDIYIVSPNTNKIKMFAEAYQLKFIDENTVFDYSVNDIDYITRNGLNRSGWIFQQLVKLSGKIGTSKYFLVIDSDHILLQPHTFVSTGKKLIFYLSTEFHFQYYHTNKKLIGSIFIPFFSYVAHKMIFDREELQKLRQKIEKQNNGLSWDKAIISNLDINEPSCFSEFELFGSFLEREKKILVPWRQKTLSRQTFGKFKNFECLREIYSKKYRSVTFPSYLK